LRVGGTLAVVAVLAAACFGTAAAQSYPPSQRYYYEPPQGYYPQPGYDTAPVPYQPLPPQRYSDAPVPPVDVGAAPGTDETGSISGANTQAGSPYSTAPSAGPPDPTLLASLPPDYRPERGPAQELPPQFRRQLIDYAASEPAGTIIIDTPHTYLYLMLGRGKALRYGIGVGREGFTWSGTERISRMSEWPDWHPPKEMIERQPYLPRFMAGGEGNPLGARALYLGNTLYRIHGTNQPSTIGHFVSSGCIRLTNADIVDLYSRVNIGTRVVVLPGSLPASASAITRPAR
jgi:lipoprotein-anchoring transpeptidase ErfK/SrfK